MNLLEQTVQFQPHGGTDILHMDGHKVYPVFSYALIHPLLAELPALRDDLPDDRRAEHGGVLEDELEVVNVEVIGGGLMVELGVEEYRLFLLWFIDLFQYFGYGHWLHGLLGGHLLQLGVLVLWLQDHHLNIINYASTVY